MNRTNAAASGGDIDACPFVESRTLLWTNLK
jgi:hypothetical protein